MEIQKIFSNVENETEKLYSVLMSEEEYNLFSEHKDYKKELGVATVGGTLGTAGYGLKKVAENKINNSKANKKYAKAANIDLKKELNERLSEAKKWKEIYKTKEANYHLAPESLKERVTAQKKLHKTKLKKLGKEISDVKEVLKYNEGIIDRANNRIKSAKKGVKLGKTSMAAGGLLVAGSTIAAGKKLLDKKKENK